MPTGISRRLSYLNQEGDKDFIDQDDILSIGVPIVVLGDPGSGKSVLTQALGEQPDALYYRAGSFLRSARIELPEGARIIIDGLDEVASTALGGGVDAVLQKLSAMGSPPFILSCREADWRGASDRIKIEDDYANKPLILHLEPFDRDDALLFLQEEFPSIDAAGALVHLTDRGLEDLYRNPLTLRLLGEVVRDEGELPGSRAQLFSRACVVMLREDNPRHDDAPHARCSSDDLLLSAGALCAVQLLCDRTGILTRGEGPAPDGWVRLADLNALPLIANAEEALRTRLFQAEGEGRFVPIHRVIAEFLGAKWLASCFEAGVSERRIFSLFVQGEGVPTSLRGLHAWTAHFSEALAARCIAADPYAVLRYGDADLLSLEPARQLLAALAALSREDPHFRSGDWVDHSASGLMREALKDDLLRIITTPRQHTQLTALLLGAMTRTPMAAVLRSDLRSLMLDTQRYYVERLRAAEALFQSDAIGDPAECLQALLNLGDADSARLAAELLDDVLVIGLSDQLIVEIILAHTGLSVSRRRDDDESRSITPYIRSSLTDGFDTDRIEGFLDLFTAYAWPLISPSTDMDGRTVIDLVRKLVVRRLGEAEPVALFRLWSWLNGPTRSDGYSAEYKTELAEAFTANPELRSALIRHVMLEQPGNTIRAGAYALWDASYALRLTAEDIATLLGDLAEAGPEKMDRERWESLVRLSRGDDGLPLHVTLAAVETAGGDDELLRILAEVSVVEIPSWKVEQAEREERRAQERQLIYQSHRDVHAAHAAEVAQGHYADLDVPADVYLGRLSEFSKIAAPEARVAEFLGEDLGAAALDGFIASLHRDDVPSALEISESHAQNRHWTIEEPLICGIAEMVRRGMPLTDLPHGVLASAMMAWRRSTESNVVGGVDIGASLEAALFTSDAEIEAHFRRSLEPQLSAGPRRDHVYDLYSLTHTREWSHIAGRLCAEWVIRYPALPDSIMRDLLNGALDMAEPSELAAMLHASRAGPAASYDALRLWLTADFDLDFAPTRADVSQAASDDPAFFWILRPRIERHRHTLRADLSISQLEFVVSTFGVQWPSVARPSGTSMGDSNDWDATAIIERVIYALAGNPSPNATQALSRLIDNGVAPSYADTLRHARNLQRKARRDHEYVAPTIAQLSAVMSEGLPEAIDDMRAYFADRLQAFQERVRGGSTDMWQAFWRATKPQTENICRNRLVDYISGQLPPSIRFEPEMHMPGQKRADIAAIRNTMGLPVEIKGQWHPAMWTAPMDQLDALYTRDWHAQGRGVYIVLWFGPGVRMPVEPDGAARPASPEALREMLIAQIPVERRAQIDVYVIDLSRPS
ncbi:hypothetical protein D3C71_185890 [compost metagenome]|jgi:hypothetical protein